MKRMDYVLHVLVNIYLDLLIAVSIIDYHACENNEDADAYVKNVVTFANSHQDGKVLVIGCGDAYVKAGVLKISTYFQRTVSQQGLTLNF